MLGDERCAVHHDGVPPQSSTRSAGSIGAVHQRGIRLLDPCGARRVHVRAEPEAARLVHLPTRQPVVERRAHAVRHPARVRQDLAAAAAGSRGARDSRRKVGGSRRSWLPANARAAAVRRCACRCAYLGELHEARGGSKLWLVPRGDMDAFGRRGRISRAHGAAPYTHSPRGRDLLIEGHQTLMQEQSHSAKPSAAATRTARGTLLRSIVRGARRLDQTIGRSPIGRRLVLVDVRNSMHGAVLKPITAALERDPRVAVYYTSETIARGSRPTRKQAGRARPHPPADRVAAMGSVSQRRSLDRPTLRRSSNTRTSFMALPGKVPTSTTRRIGRSLSAVRSRALHQPRSNGSLSRRRPRHQGSAPSSSGSRKSTGWSTASTTAAPFARPRSRSRRPTALYAPTWSPASSLNLAGEAIIRTLADAGWNVIVKLHSLSLDRAHGKIQRRRRPARAPGCARAARLDRARRRCRCVSLLAASDLMVDRHSTIGFEFCLLDRPLIVFDMSTTDRDSRASIRRASVNCAAPPASSEPSASSRKRREPRVSARTN